MHAIQYETQFSMIKAPSMQCISVDRLRCNLLVFRPLCKSWLINTQGWLSSILNYKGQKYAITQNILYVSIQSVVYLHVFRLKKDGLNFLICADCCLFYYKQAWMLLLLFFLMANTVKGFSTWILWQKRLSISHL